MQQLIYEHKEEKGNAVYQIFIDAKEEFFYIRYEGDVSQDFHTKTSLQFLKEVEKYRYSRFIFDISDRKSSHFKSRIWFVSYVTRKAYNIIRDKSVYASVINSSSPIERSVTNIIIRSVSRLNANIKVRLFNANSIEEAQNWTLKDRREMLLVS